MSDVSHRPVVWMYSGQGSQYFAMGQELYQSEPVFRETFDMVSDYASQWIGASIAHIVYKHEGGRFDPFDRTLHTHPALFAVQYALDRTLRDRGFRPDYVLGYSLGEFVAFTVGGVLAWRDAVRALLYHAQTLERTPLDGRMMAILDSPVLFHELSNRFPGLELAAVNTPRHFVITGATSLIQQAQEWLSGCDIDSVTLPVTQPFHSSALGFADDSLRRLMETFFLGEVETPIVSSERAGILRRLSDGVSWRMTRGAIRFQRALAELEASGPKQYVDLGPSATLASFVRQNLAAGAPSEVIPIITPFAQDRKNLEAAGHKLRASTADFSFQEGLV
jgi:bacillaene synthase trans-acting acyltransferase